MADLDSVKAKVQQLLVDRYNGVSLEKFGEFSLRHESARAFVRVFQPDADGEVFVKVVAPVLFGVTDGPDLWKHVAYHADDYFFGHLSLETDSDGETSIFFTHLLLGDYLDAEELHWALGACLTTANNLDDELQAQFGGRRFHEE